MALRGQRFEVDFSSDEEDYGERPVYKQPAASAPVLPGFVKDVTERSTGAARAPVAPAPRNTVDGFPAHKKRVPASKFKQARTGTEGREEQPKRQDAPTARSSSIPNNTTGVSTLERQQIDKENREKLANMSEASIAKERRELMDGLSPSLIQRLLRRANIDDEQAADFPPQTKSLEQPREAQSQRPESIHEPPDEDDPQKQGQAIDTTGLEDGQHPQEPAPQTSALDSSLPTSTHFPRIPQPPSLDPSSPNFLTELHEKYFPDLSHDPSKLAWMTSSDDAPTTDGEQPQRYDPASQDLPISALRFAFSGALLPPSAAQSIPVSKGLHHHGDAPEAAGYTIGELAHLARSQFPSQRCFAFQTLGRILYRLGIGEFGRLERGFKGGARMVGGDDDNDDDDEDEGEGLAKGLWDCIREGRVLSTLEEEAARPGGHVSAKAYAVEALWLWRKGGGTEVRAT